MAQWKEIKSFSDYEASSEGVIRNKETKQTIKPFKQTNGYYKIKLYREHKPYTKMLHRVIAATYLGESKLDVNHKDGNKTNNNIKNLEYVTKSDNMKHAYKNGLVSLHLPLQTTKKKVYCVTLNKTYESLTDASKQTNISKVEIRRVCNKVNKQTHGLIFTWLA